MAGCMMIHSPHQGAGWPLGLGCVCEGVAVGFVRVRVGDPERIIGFPWVRGLFGAWFLGAAFAHGAAARGGKVVQQ